MLAPAAATAGLMDPTRGLAAASVTVQPPAGALSSGGRHRGSQRHPGLLSPWGRSRCWKPRLGWGQRWALAAGPVEAQPPSPEETRPAVPSHTKAALGDLALIEAQRGRVWEMWPLHPSQPPRGPDLLLRVGSVGDALSPLPGLAARQPPASTHARCAPASPGHTCSQLPPCAQDSKT